MVSSYVKFQIRISFLQVGNHIVHLALQLIHLCIILLDDAQGNAILPIMPDDVSAYGRMLLYLTQVLELEQPPLMVDINIAHIIHRQNLTVEMHIILVNAISHRKGRQSDVILSQGSLQLLHRDAQSRQFVRIRHTLNLRGSQSAHIHHGCGRQLLQATAHHISGKVAQLGKLCRSLLPRWFTTERDVEEKAGISEALALMTLGRTTSFGIFPIAMSIFSFTSMKSMSMLAPGSNFNKIFPTSIRESELMLFTPDTCASCPLRGAITRFPSLAQSNLAYSPAR